MPGHFRGCGHHLQHDESLAPREVHAAAEARRDQRPDRHRLGKIRLGDDPAGGRVVRLTAVAAPIDLPNVDTDRIIPTRFLRKGPGSPEYARCCFHDVRFDAEGRERGLAALRHVLRREPDVVYDLLFGSGATGGLHAESDVVVRLNVFLAIQDARPITSPPHVGHTGLDLH